MDDRMPLDEASEAYVRGFSGPGSAQDLMLIVDDYS